MKNKRLKNDKRGWDFTERKVVTYVNVNDNGMVINKNGRCVGNIKAGDFSLTIPHEDLSKSIVSSINFILKEQKISQRKFAEMLRKKEPEVSKFLSGKHNFTLKTISLIESVLGAKLILTIYSVKKLKDLKP